MKQGFYAHIKVVVAFLVVNFFTQWSYLGGIKLDLGRNLVEILPRDLLGLSKPSGDLGNSRKIKFQRRVVLEHLETVNKYYHFSIEGLSNNKKRKGMTATKYDKLGKL